MLVCKAFDFYVKSEWESCWVFLVVVSLLLSLKIYHAIPFWLVEFLLRNQLITWWEFPCMFFVIFPLLLFNILSISLIFLSLIIMCWCIPPWVYPAWHFSGLLGYVWLFPFPRWGSFQLLRLQICSQVPSLCFLLLGSRWCKYWCI